MALGCAQWVVMLTVGSVQLWWKAGYLKKGGEATAPEALKGCFIPKGSVVRWATPTAASAATGL